MKAPSSFKRLALFSDIHFGRKSNSPAHNQDCLDFVEWFCAQVRGNGGYSHVCFLGDWFESRSALNVETLDRSYAALKLIDGLGLPVYFVVGNHDLHRRTTRDVHSVRIFNELRNVRVIDEVTVEDGLLFAPYLFEHEYPRLAEHVGLWAWLGHFEFRGFTATSNHVIEHGPDPSLFAGPKRIFAGHLHKRQQAGNVHYIGSAFPHDYGDAGDYARGMATYRVAEDELTFTDWAGCPKYYKTRLSSILDGSWEPRPKMRVRCVLDGDLGYQDAQDLRAALIAKHGLRDLTLEEDRSVKRPALETASVTALDLTTIDDLVVDQLETCRGQVATIDPDVLIEIYRDLRVEAEVEP